MFDYSFLRSTIIKRFRTYRNFAHTIGINHVTLSLKLQNRISFRQHEILEISKLLRYSPADMKKAFFTEKKTETGE